jgi:hypothetical protein
MQRVSKTQNTCHSSHFDFLKLPPHSSGKNTLGKVPSDYTRKIRAGLYNLNQFYFRKALLYFFLCIFLSFIEQKKS